jgi:hypothetical protein
MLLVDFQGVLAEAGLFDGRIGPKTAFSGACLTEVAANSREDLVEKEMANPGSWTNEVYGRKIRS